MDLDKEINDLISLEQYSLNQKQKEKKLLPIIKKQLLNQIKDKKLKRFYDQIMPIDKINSLSDIPPLPVNLFKKHVFELVSKKDIIRTLTSSGTTSQIKSKIDLDKKTAFRQTSAYSSILKNYLGTSRKPLLVIDTPQVNDPKLKGLSARGAAIRGIIPFGKNVTYVLEGSEKLKLNLESLENFVKENNGQEIIMFGFTYIIWSIFYKELKKLKKKYDIKFTIIHSGGWKKLTSEKVDKKHFTKELKNMLGQDSQVLDMYGLVEQLGVVFIDCDKGHKHCPNFADIIIRNPLTLEEVKENEIGLIEIISVLPNSYPGQALLTEDIGLFLGKDSCECGRKGKYFKFVSRVEKSEPRGCGDTFTDN